MKEADFKRKRLNLVLLLDISGSMGSPFDGGPPAQHRAQLGQQLFACGCGSASWGQSCRTALRMTTESCSTAACSCEALPSAAAHAVRPRPLLQRML